MRDADCPAHQRVTIVGDKGRIEVAIPFNAPPDRPTHITIDSGADLVRRRRAGRGISRSAINIRCRATPSRAPCCGEAPLEFPIEDAIANMRVIDALFRSAKSGRGRSPDRRYVSIEGHMHLIAGVV